MTLFHEMLAALTPLIGIQRTGLQVNPVAQQKQFMQLVHASHSACFQLFTSRAELAADGMLWHLCP